MRRPFQKFSFRSFSFFFWNLAISRILATFASDLKCKFSPSPWWNFEKGCGFQRLSFGCLETTGNRFGFPPFFCRQSTWNIEIEVGLHSCYGGTRRLTRVDVQFSGDESRRLFANGAKVAENTAENRNLGVITYGSVVFQLKDANLEANNICDFVFRGMRVVCRTRVVTVCLFCLSAVPILMLIYGEWGKFVSRGTRSILEIFSLVLIQLACASSQLEGLFQFKLETGGNWPRKGNEIFLLEKLSIELRSKHTCGEFHVSSRVESILGL